MEREWEKKMGMTRLDLAQGKHGNGWPTFA